MVRLISPSRYASAISLGAVSAAVLTACAGSAERSSAGASCEAPPTVAAVQPAASASPLTPPELTPPPIDAAKPADYPGLHNVVTYADGLYSGAAPEGDEAFDSLRSMGVKTIISVDGAQPDAELAAKHGLRYVHLPIGYNGMSHERTLEIARAAKDLPGPIYIHCHHGKHRSAGAAGAVAVTLGYSTPEKMLDRMKVSGTAPGYTGLFKCVQVAEPAAPAELAAVSNEFPTHWRTSGLVKTMVSIDEATDRLKLIEKAGWRVPADHPDLVPAAEAGQLADHFRIVADDPDVKAKPVEVAEWLRRDGETAAALEAVILKLTAGGSGPTIGAVANGAGSVGGATPAEASALFKTLTASCKECHAKHRD